MRTGRSCLQKWPRRWRSSCCRRSAGASARSSTRYHGVPCCCPRPPPPWQPRRRPLTRLHDGSGTTTCPRLYRGPFGPYTYTAGLISGSWQRPVRDASRRMAGTNLGSPYVWRQIFGCACSRRILTESESGSGIRIQSLAHSSLWGPGAARPAGRGSFAEASCTVDALAAGRCCAGGAAARLPAVGRAGGPPPISNLRSKFCSITVCRTDPPEVMGPREEPAGPFRLIRR